jgi:formate dehydrogenase iron-sulfur subunit
MQKTPEGPVIYDSELCMGCRYCLVACPYGIPRYEWDEAAPLVKKCTLCDHRIVEGKEPACVEACPEDALLFGERDELLEVAHQRIAENPGTYLNHVYGETEVGGTSVLYLSDISLGFLGWAENLGDGDLPHLTHAALKKVPWTILGMGSLMGGIYWVINRRMKLAARAAEGEMLSARVGDVLSSESEGASEAPPPEKVEGGQDHE